MLIVLALKEGVPPSKDYSASNSMMLQATSVYRVPYTRHVTSTVQRLIKGMPRTGLNRHRRGYATKEAGSAVHFPVSGPIGLARSHILVSYPIIIIIQPSCNSKVLLGRSTDPIALSIAYGPNKLVIRDNQGMALSNPTSCI